ncbi:MAG: 2Fe-2S iron-sulfur cluster-binding protein [Aureliella sp.]
MFAVSENPSHAVRNRTVPKITVENEGTFEVEAGKKLVLALKEDAGTDQLHACGGNARCTTCRVEIVEGAPGKMTLAEKDCLEQRGLAGVRLSCQIPCESDMTVRVVSRLEGSGRADTGNPVAQTLLDDTVWVDAV